MITKVLYSVYKTNLSVKKEETVLIFTDIISPREIIPANDLCRRERLRDIALLTAEIGKSFSKRILYHEYPATASHGAEPPEEMWGIAFGEKALKELKRANLLKPLIEKDIKDNEIKKAESIIEKNKKYSVNVVIALSNYSTSHTRFRDFLVRICGCRYASMPLFDISMLEGPMNVDWKNLSKRTKAISKLINKADTVEIKTPNGTHISMSKRGRPVYSDDGILTKPGSFGNLPAGESFFAPIEGTSNGRLVLEWAPTHELGSPIILTVTNGYVEDIIGDDPYADYLRTKLNERQENRNIAEMGIGTNDRAKRPNNILESEKILGTIHIAFGDNSSFGGVIMTPFHQDYVFFKPTVKLITKDLKEILLLEDGILKL